MAPKYPFSYAGAVKHFYGMLQPILQRTSNEACESFLHEHVVFLPDATDAAIARPPLFSWLPTLPSHTQLNPAASALHTDILDEPPSSPAEWAAVFRIALNRILRHYRRASSTDSQSSIANLDIPQHDDPWMGLLLAGEPTTWDPARNVWQAVSLLEDGGGHVSCLLADGSPDPGPRCLLQSELVCLLSLACRQLSRAAKNRHDQHSSQIAMTITTFTSTSARLVRAFLELPRTPDSPPSIKIYDLRQTLVSDLVGQPANEARLDVLAWLCSATPRSAASELLVVPKHRKMVATVGNEGKRLYSAGDTASERLFSGSSEESGALRSRQSSPSSSESSHHLY